MENTTYSCKKKKVLNFDFQLFFNVDDVKYSLKMSANYFLCQYLTILVVCSHTAL